VSYDQWKTASPYDDEIDVEEEIDKYIKRMEANITLGNAVNASDVIRFLKDLKEWIPEQ
jgi:hypothetical protein